MVTGRADIAERVVCRPGKDQVGSGDGSAGRDERRIQRVRIHRRVGVELHQPGLGRELEDSSDVCRVVHARELLLGGGLRLFVNEDVQQPVTRQTVVDGGHACRAFGVPGHHVVQPANVVLKVGGLHAGGPDFALCFKHEACMRRWRDTHYADSLTDVSGR